MKHLVTIQEYQDFFHKEGSRYELLYHDDDGRHIIYQEIGINGHVFDTHKVLKQDRKEWDELCELHPINKKVKNIKCFDASGIELKSGDIVDVQLAGHHTIYKKDDGQLYFRPYGNEEKVSDYFSNDMIKV